jgi:dynein heavy chain
MRNLCKISMKDMSTSRGEWILKWPAQCVLSINSTRWTRQSESAILKWGTGGQKWDLGLFLKDLNAQLLETVELVRKDLTNL